MRKSQLSVWEYKRLQQSETKEKLNKKKKGFQENFITTKDETSRPSSEWEDEKVRTIKNI